jgi:hypothetical protein
MGIQINGNTNNINAGIGSLSIEDLREIDIVGVATAANFKTGTSNLHSTGLNIFDLDVDGHTELDNARIAGVATFNQGGSEVVRINSGGLLLYNDLSFFGASTHAYWDHSANQFKLNDNTKLSVGSSSDLSIFHDGSNSHLHDSGDGVIYLRTNMLQVNNAANNQTFADFSSSAANLYSGNSRKFQTTNTGVVVTGICTATSFSGDGSNLTGITGTTINNNADNLVITGSGTANTLEAEANLTFETATSGGTLTVAGTSEYQIKLKDSNTSGNGAETALAFTDSGNTVQGFVGYNYWGDGNIDLQNNNSGGSVCINTGGGNERLVVTSDGDIYGPSGGRKNWLDNGSFDCRGGRRANTSMDYGNHHAYGWVTDRFMSRNSVQWSRSTNVPTGKGFSYSTQTNSGAGSLMQAVELPDYGDMGVFAPSSYWCVSVWSTTTINHSASAFSYDLGSTKTNATVVHPTGTNTYASTGETASGTSTGTFTRYYMVFQMPSSIISGATAFYFTWFLNNAGYATGWQLERVPTATSKPTPYEHVHPSVTIARCRRYAYQCVNSRLGNGYKRHDSYIHWPVQFPVPPTHMPSGPNQSATPYGIIIHDAGLLTNYQSILQNPGINSASISEFDYRSGRFLIVASTSYSPTHTTVPSWESQEYEIQHGFF